MTLVVENLSKAATDIAAGLKEEEYGGCGSSHQNLTEAALDQSLRLLGNQDIEIVTQTIHGIEHADYSRKSMLDRVPEISDRLMDLLKACAFDPDPNSAVQAARNLATLQEQLRSVDLVMRTNDISQIEKVLQNASDIWDLVKGIRDDAFLGLVVANTNFKWQEADQRVHTSIVNGKHVTNYSFSRAFMGEVFRNSRADLEVQRPSELRYYAIATYHTDYMLPFKDIYSLMLEYGSLKEVDAALFAINACVKHATTPQGRDELPGVCLKYREDLNTMLLEGSFVHTANELSTPIGITSLGDSPGETRLTKALKIVQSIDALFTK